MNLNDTAYARFWSKVNKTEGCWLWTARRDRHGYGKFRPDGANGSEVGAHRVSWVMANVRPIPAHLLVCHTCDVRHCVRPSHLWLGTPADNSADMAAKGRAPRITGPRPNCQGDLHWRRRNAERYEGMHRGVDNPSARLDEDVVRAIRAAYAGGESQGSIGRRLGVPQAHISRIVRRVSWAHVD